MSGLEFLGKVGAHELSSGLTVGSEVGLAALATAGGDVSVELHLCIFCILVITSSNRAWSLSRGNERWIDFGKRDFQRQNPIDLEFFSVYEKTVSGKVDERELRAVIV